MTTTYNENARRLRNAVEPVAAGVYFAPEAHAANLLEHLHPWSEAIIDAGSHPTRLRGVYNVGGGPHFGLGLTIDTAAELRGQKA